MKSPPPADRPMDDEVLPELGSPEQMAREKRVEDGRRRQSGDAGHPPPHVKPRLAPPFGTFEDESTHRRPCFDPLLEPDVDRLLHGDHRGHGGSTPAMAPAQR